MNRSARKYISFSLFLLISSAAAAQRDEDSPLKFKSHSYPIVISIPANYAAGEQVFDSGVSESPSGDYNTVLLEGEMSDPSLNIVLSIRSKDQPDKFDMSGQMSIKVFPNGRFWAKYAVGRAVREPLKIAVRKAGLKKDAFITIYSTELLLESPGEKITAAAPVPAADPALYLPPNLPFRLVRRAEWKAKAPTDVYVAHAPTGFTIHHTNAHYPANYNDSLAEMRFIQDYHQQAKGWIDVGYHFLIDPFGNIFEGRPVNAEGAHVSFHNPGNIGISIMGSYHPPVSNILTNETVKSFVTLGRYLKDSYSVEVSSFYAHRDIGSSLCPGDGIYAKKNMLRDLIFTPQPAPVRVETGKSAPLNPAQSESLRQLMDYLK